MGNVFDANASRCIVQCIVVTSWFLCFTKDVTPAIDPHITGAPHAQCIRSICTMYTLHMYNVYAPYVQCIRSICTMYTLHMYTAYIYIGNSLIVNIVDLQRWNWKECIYILNFLLLIYLSDWKMSDYNYIIIFILKINNNSFWKF